MIGHVTMDIGLFAYWWTGIAGNFAERPVTETGVDIPFVMECVALVVSLLVVVLAIKKFRERLTPRGSLPPPAARRQ